MADDIHRERADNRAFLSRIEEEEFRELSEQLSRCFQLMRRAYEAQMAFARCSLESIRESRPGLYASALSAYRDALQEQFLADVETMRSKNEWQNNEFERTLLADRFLNAPFRNDHGQGIRRQMAQSIELREEMLRLRQKFVRRMLEERCSSAEYEFVTDASLVDYSEEEPQEGASSAPSSELLRLYDEAEKCWASYAEESTQRYYCPIKAWAGTDTLYEAYFLVGFELWAHHEDFLADLLYGFGVEDEEDVEEE